MCLQFMSHDVDHALLASCQSWAMQQNPQCASFEAARALQFVVEVCMSVQTV